MLMIFRMGSYILSVFSYLIPICCFLPFKLKGREKITFYAILLINILLIGYQFGNIGVIFLIISSCIYITIINSNWLLNICIFIATYLFCVLGDNMFSLLWDTFIYPISKLQNSPYYILYVTSYVLLLAIVCPIIAKIIYYLARKICTGISKQLLILVAINLFVCFFVFLFNIVIGECIGYSRKIIIFNCILFSCYFLVCTVLTIHIVKAHMARVDMDMRQDAYNRLRDYTNQIENMYASLRSFKHDYRNIMLSMYGYIETGDINGLETYFHNEIIPLNEKLFIDTAHLNQLMNIRSTELKSIISAKLLYAAELNINVRIEIVDEILDIPIDVIDLSRILGIYLDNAIEATLETKSPSMRFAIINLKSEYVFVVTNTFIDTGLPYESFRQQMFSTKGDNRGIGLYNVQKILSKYDHVFWETEADDNCFTQRLRILKNKIL